MKFKTKTRDQKLIEKVKAGKFKIFQKSAKPLEYLEDEVIQETFGEQRLQFYPQEAKKQEQKIEKKLEIKKESQTHREKIVDPDDLEKQEGHENRQQQELKDSTLINSEEQELKELYQSIQAVGMTVEEEKRKISLGIKHSAQQIKSIKSKEQLVFNFQNLLDYEYLPNSSIKNPDFSNFVLAYLENNGHDAKVNHFSYQQVVSFLTEKIKKQVQDLKEQNKPLYDNIQATFELFESYSELKLVLLEAYIADRCKFVEQGSLLQRFLVLISQLSRPMVFREVQQKAIAMLRQKKIKQKQIAQLSGDPFRGLKLYFVDMIQNFNKFEGLLNILRYSAGQISKLRAKDQLIDDLATRLESLLNSKVLFQKAESFEKTETDYSVPGTMATSPSFEYGSALEKMKMIQEYHSEKQKLKQLESILNEIKAFLENGKGDVMTAQRFQQIRIVMSVNDYGNQALNDKARKVNLITNSLFQRYVKQTFNFKLSTEPLTFENLYKIYDPELSGRWDLIDRRNELVSLGMNSSLADSLALKFIGSTYLNQDSQVFSFIDLLENKAVIDLEKMRVDFMTKGQYFRELEGLFKRRAEAEPSQRVRSNSLLNVGSLKEKKRISNLVRPTSLYFFSSQPLQDESDKKDSFHEYLKILDQVDQQRLKEEEMQREKVQFKKLWKQPEEKKFLKGALFAAEKKKQLEEEDMKYSTDFFIEKFAFKEASLSQKYLEEFIRQSLKEDQIPDFVASIVKQATKLSQHIPNIQFMLYKIFCTPLSSKDQKLEQHSELVDMANISKDLLFGNLFSTNIGLVGYKSILQSLMMKKKKKHMKKLLAHMDRYEQLPDIQFIELFQKVCIKHGFPILLGRTMKEWIGPKSLQVPLQYITKTILYLESCKGYEEDAKLFLFYLGGQPHYNLDWSTSAPLFRRYIKYHHIDSLIGFYEQFRKKIVINNPAVQDPEEYEALREEKFRELHFNLIRELTQRNRLKAGNVIFNELILSEKDETKRFRSREELEIVLNFNAKCYDFKSFLTNAECLEERFTLDKQSAELLFYLMNTHFQLNEDVKEKYLGFYEHLVEELGNSQIRDFKGEYIFELVKIFMKEKQINIVENLVYWVHSEMSYREEAEDLSYSDENKPYDKKIGNPMPPKGLLAYLKDVVLHSNSQEQKYKLNDLIQLLVMKQRELTKNSGGRQGSYKSGMR